MSSSDEICRRAFPDQAIPLVSYGLSFIETVQVHNENNFKASRIYILASGSLSRNTSHLKDLQASLGDKVAGIRIGMKSHTYISEVLEIVNDARRVNADLILSLGGGTLVDAAKIVSFVRVSYSMILQPTSIRQ